MIEFAVHQTDGLARAGTLATPRGDLQTPLFMPVGTRASVRTLTPADVRAAGGRMILANTYHLLLRPGPEIVAAVGGLHRFMAWDGPILTDSGGFQVFSLGGLRTISDDGVVFRSHIDGARVSLSPERAVAVQQALGADVIMALDQPPPPDADHTHARIATERTHRWLARCMAAQATDQALFGICQGGMHADLRRASAVAVAASGAPGCAIGGLSVGESKATMWQMLAASLAELPAAKPRYLMGVGSPEDLVQAVGQGVDMFDCVLPTRLGRNGALFTADGRVNITNARYARADGPVDPACACETCVTFPAAYLHHLFRAGELLGYRLASIHNISFLTRLMAQARAAILERRFSTFASVFLARYRVTSEAVRIEQKSRWASRRARTDH